MRAFSPYVWIYYVLIVAIGGFFVINLFLAVLLQEFIAAQEANAAQEAAELSPQAPSPADASAKGMAVAGAAAAAKPTPATTPAATPAAAPAAPAAAQVAPAAAPTAPRAAPALRGAAAAPAAARAAPSTAPPPKQLRGPGAMPAPVPMPAPACTPPPSPPDLEKAELLHSRMQRSDEPGESVTPRGTWCCDCPAPLHGYRRICYVVGTSDTLGNASTALVLLNMVLMCLPYEVGVILGPTARCPPVATSPWSDRATDRALPSRRYQPVERPRAGLPLLPARGATARWPPLATSPWSDRALACPCYQPVDRPLPAAPSPSPRSDAPCVPWLAGDE